MSALHSVRVPDSVNSELAALAEPLAVGLKLLHHAQVQPTERLLVIGAGPIGLAVVLWARQYAVGDILVSDPVRSRQSLALELGATAVVDPTRESLTEACPARELGGLPKRSSSASADRASCSLRRGGRTLGVSSWPGCTSSRIPSHALNPL